MSKFAPRTAMKLGVIGIAATLLLAGCASSSSAGTTSSSAITTAEITKAMNTPTTIQLWSWLANIQSEVKLFEQKYPKIKVVITNNGGGSPQYIKLRAAIKSGQVPDVAQVEYQYIPSFRSDLVNLAPYGANSLKSQYISTAWQGVSQGDAVYGMPQDIGPMGNLWRTDILAKAGVSEPTTWAQFATAAAAIKQKTGAYITNIPSGDPGQITGLLQQAGATMFSYTGGSKVGIYLDSPKAKQVMNYWNGLVKAGYVSTDSDFNTAWYAGFTNGKYAGWLTAAWGPLFLEGAAPTTSGKWQAGPLPQWSSGQNLSGDWGGSSYAVIKGSKHEIAAYELAKFITNDSASSLLLATKQSEFPPLKTTLANTEFSGLKDPFFQGEEVNKEFSKIAPTVNGNVEWPPFMDYVYSSFNNTLGAALANKTDLVTGLEAWQTAVVTYAKQQGFTVTQ
jgi:multiple sugar transport system substrate-binding protein